MSHDDEAQEAARRIAAIKADMALTIPDATPERRSATTDVGPIDVDLDATVISVRRGDGDTRNIQIYLSCTGGYEATCSFDIARSASAATLNSAIRTEARVFAFTAWGVEPSVSSRVVLFGGATV